MGLIKLKLDDWALYFAKNNLLWFGYILEVIGFIHAGFNFAHKQFLLLILNLIIAGVFSYIVGKGIEYDILINN